MTQLNVNFDDVPDKVMPIGPGLYDLEVVDTPTLEAVSKGPNAGKMMVVAKLRVTNEGEFQNRTLIHNMCVWTELGQIDIKRFCLSAGVPVGSQGVDLVELTGVTIKAQIVTRTYKDDQGADQETHSVKKILIPGDEG